MMRCTEKKIENAKAKGRSADGGGGGAYGTAHGRHSTSAWPSSSVCPSDQGQERLCELVVGIRHVFA